MVDYDKPIAECKVCGKSECKEPDVCAEVNGTKSDVFTTYERHRDRKLYDDVQRHIRAIKRRRRR